ncbi:MAG: MMPL family transporter, partial [Halobacteriovoraceae bacterium]|nr:MMPL family transporter [Halobacteriovoraceae bacterium]
MVKKFLDTLIDCNLKFGKHCLILSFLLTILGLFFIPNVKTNFNNRLWPQQDSPSVLDLNEFEKTFGNDDTIAFIIEFKKGVFKRESLQILRQITKRVHEVHNVIRVESLSNYYWIHSQNDEIITEKFIPESAILTSSFLQEKRKQAFQNKTIFNLYVNHDATIAMVYGHLALPKSDKDNRKDISKTVADINKIIKSFEQNKDLTFHLLGDPVIQSEFSKTSFRDISLILPLSLLAVLLLLAFYFRTIPGVVIPVFVVGSSVICSL